jgi:putative transposase
VFYMDVLEPKDHGEAVALFRSEVVGVLTRLDLPRGELAARLKTLSEQRFRPPVLTRPLVERSRAVLAQSP